MSELNDELMPCPFCGGDAEAYGEEPFQTHVFRHAVTAGGFYVECETEGCCRFGVTGEDPDPGYVYGAFETHAAAVAAWNARDR